LYFGSSPITHVLRRMCPRSDHGKPNLVFKQGRPR
jgi:hypothetical protein